ncbi:MAG TPA: hypothetical protein ENN07_07475 [candidate division Zixibacteria bacterium]|nr:hypothetical protein [candidate division Zixibacteria bacterium]
MKLAKTLLPMLIIATALVSADSLDVSLVGRYTATSPEQMIVVGDRGFVANSSGGLQILDVSNPSLPVELGYRFLPGNATGICALGDFIGMACSDSTFRILDPRDPTDIQIVGEFRGDAPIFRCESHGDTVFLNGGKFCILDLSSPTAPIQISEFDFVFEHLRFAVDGNFAFLAEKNYGLSVVDISNPASPSGAGRYFAFDEFVRSAAVDRWGRVFVATNRGVIAMQWQSGELEQVGFWPTEHPAYDITIDGRYAFVACGAAGMRVLDISTPSAMSEVGYYRLGSELTDIFLDYPLVWVTGLWARINAMDISPFAYIAETRELPANFTISAYPNPFNSAVTITIDGLGARHASPLQQLSVEIYHIAGRRVDAVATSGQPVIAMSDSDEKSPTIEGDFSPSGRNDGKNEFIWTPPASLPSGVYLVRASAGNGTFVTKRVVFMK